MRVSSGVADCGGNSVTHGGIVGGRQYQRALKKNIERKLWRGERKVSAGRRGIKAMARNGIWFSRSVQPSKYRKRHQWHPWQRENNEIMASIINISVGVNNGGVISIKSVRRTE